MILLDEVHTIEMIVGGESRVLTTGKLNTDGDSLDALRSRAANEAASYFGIEDKDAFVAAFDKAFDQCEARPGNESTASVSFDGGDIVVARTLYA